MTQANNTKPRSFFRKQFWLIVGINMLTLAFASGLLYSNFVSDYTDNLINITRTKGLLLSSVSHSALLFNDTRAATENLAFLKHYPATRYAQIFDTNHQLFAEYMRKDQVVLPVEALSFGASFSNNNMYWYASIDLDEQILGYILISTDTESLQAQQKRYALIIILVYIVSLLLAYILNLHMQKRLTTPISQLINLVSNVAQKREYNKRLTLNRNDELGDLFRGINLMLDTIEQHKIQLQADSNRLENVVKLRTKQLQQHSDQLESVVKIRTEQLYNRANYDALTQLPNRHLLTDRLSHGIIKAQRSSSMLVLMFLDLNRFKVINDSLGHLVGDQLLSHVANKLTGVIRGADSVARWGGDEFVLLLENITSLADIEKIADQVVKSLNSPILIDIHELHISASIGIAIYPQDGGDPMSLLKHADISMYKSKEKGLGQYCFFHPDMLVQSVERLSLENQLRTAVEKQQFFLVYQPQICAISGKVIGMEALIRWQNGSAVISPLVFLPLVEEIGLMHHITQWVLNEACQQNWYWQQAGLPKIRVAVNFPVSALLHKKCVEDIQNALKTSGLEAQYLEIEITEDSFISSTEKAIRVLQQLQNLNINIAIDDFGTGYSSLSYLRDLPVNALKIDGSFIQGLGESQANDGIVQSIITLGKSLNLLVVGECVEDQAQFDILAKMQCDVIQGYFFSRPLSANDMAGYLQNKG
ncbi:MAG: diguanylate cyclase (GGDEF)-like protein [Paraglaciecola sp.]|jgi:diguanylate cyclase (GGDEF)-like protein